MNPLIPFPKAPIPFPRAERRVEGGVGYGRGIDARLRAVEGDIREIRTQMESVATKADIGELSSSMKVWILSSTVAALALVVGWLVFWIVRLATG